MSEEPCHLCAQTRTTRLPGLRRDLRHCPTCDLVFAPVAARLSPEQEKSRYLQHRNSLEDEGYAEMLRRPIRLLREHATGVQAVLDYGSGPEPALVTLLNREGYQATGYDPFFGGTAPPDRESAAAPGGTVGEATHQALSAEDAVCFDAVVSVETFEHFAAPPRELDRILAYLAPSGYLLIQTLLHQGAESFEAWWYARDATHIAFYSHATMDWIARTWGFRVIHQDEKNLTLMQRGGC